MKNKVIGGRIKERREALGMSQEALALKLGYSGKTAISKIERGVNGVSSNQLVSIAEALRTNIMYLFGLVDDPEYDPWNTPIKYELKLTMEEENLINKLRLLPDKDVEYVYSYVNIKYGSLFENEKSPRRGFAGFSHV